MPKKVAQAAKAEKQIPENIQKKLARDQKVAKAKKDALAKAKKDRAEARKLALANAEKYAKEYAAADKAIVDGKRAAKKDGNFFVRANQRLPSLSESRVSISLPPSQRRSCSF